MRRHIAQQRRQTDSLHPHHALLVIGIVVLSIALYLMASKPIFPAGVWF